MRRSWVYFITVDAALTDLLAWLEPRALLLALALPPVIRVVGHLIPEELFMIAMGVLARRADSPMAAGVLLLAVLLSHLTADHAFYRLGFWLRHRLQRFPRIHRRLRAATAQLEASPGALYMLVPARVLPLGRGSWLAACGVAGVTWTRFLAVDLLALLTHVALWCGIGWWVAGDLSRRTPSADVGIVGLTWLVVTLLAVVTAVVILRRWPVLAPATARAVESARRTLRQLTQR